MRASHRRHSSLVVFGLLLASGTLAGQTPAAPTAPNAAALLAQARVVTERLGGRAVQPFYLTAARAERVQPVAATDRGAAAWVVDGNPGAAVVLSFELPDAVRHTRNPAAGRLPITFPNGAARWQIGSEARSGRTFDPAVGTVGVFARTPQPQIRVRLGGTVLHAPDAAPGAYTGAVTLTVFYL